MEGLYLPEFGKNNKEDSWNTDVFLQLSDALMFCKSMGGESYFWNSLTSKLPGGKYQTIRLLKELNAKLGDPHYLDVNPKTGIISFIEKIEFDSFDISRIESYRSSAVVFSTSEVSDIWHYMLRFEGGFSSNVNLENKAIGDICILRSISDEIFVWSSILD